MSSWRVIEGDCREVLRELPDESVQCCVTSPPYFGLRDYGVDGQLGLEESPDLWVEELVAVFREVRRVLRSDGTLWLNLGDAYNSNAGTRRPGRGLTGYGKHSYWSNPSSSRRVNAPGLKPKDLIGLPWMTAFALRSDGWWLRAENIWDKPNGMPESASDRPGRHHEHVFLLTKSARYFYDRDGYREPDCGRPSGNGFAGRESRDHTPQTGGPGGPAWKPGSGRNLRSVWRVPVRPFAGAHFATFPSDLVERCVLVSSRRGDTILDPFAGAATTALPALRQGRSFIGIELNPDYCKLARNRIRDDAPLLNTASEAAA